MSRMKSCLIVSIYYWKFPLTVLAFLRITAKYCFVLRLPSLFITTVQTTVLARKLQYQYKAFLKCSHCIVSPDNKLLVCCIGSEILVHQLDGRNAPWKVPHNHSGLIKWKV